MLKANSSGEATRRARQRAAEIRASANAPSKQEVADANYKRLQSRVKQGYATAAERAELIRLMRLRAK